MVSHSQYVCADAYLSPMPSSFDAGTSPLALLEKTCLSVGHPDGKSSKSGLLSDKSPAKKDGGSQSSPDKIRHSANSPDSKAKGSPGTSASADKSERSNSVGGKTDENGNKTKSEGDRDKAGRPDSAPTEPGATSQPIPPSLPSLPTPSRGMPGFPSPYAGLPGFPHPASFPTYPHSFPPFPFSAYSGFSPLSGLGALPRPGLPCLDLNCKTCPPSPLAGRPCPLGCTQCTVAAHHGDLSSMWLSYTSLLNSGLSQMPNSLFPGFGLAASAASATSKLPASLVTTSASSSIGSASPGSAASGGQHFCSWVTPTGICWQRFDSSDELLQHVKSHTTATSSTPSSTPSSSTPSSTSSSSSSSSTTTTAAASTSGPIPGLPSPIPASSVPGRMSPRSAYLSALRFHPYGKPASHPALSMGPPPPPFPPALPYSALSALYGHRLPGTLPHP